MKAIQAVIFDLDDTLFPEREYAWSGFRAVALAHRGELDDPKAAVADLGRLFDGENRARVFDALLRERFGRVDRDLLTAMIRTYREHAPAITPYPDVNAALTRLRARFKLGLITDGRAEGQWAKIDALQLRPRFDRIIVTADLAAQSQGDAAAWSKPHPRAFEEMAQHLGVPHAGCAYVADNVSKDFVAPNALGWMTVRVLRPGGVYADAACAAGGEAEFSIKSLDELDPLLERVV
jgi:putative hydrolase of the HAD superfamily